LDVADASELLALTIADHGVAKGLVRGAVSCKERQSKESKMNQLVLDTLSDKIELILSLAACPIRDAILVTWVSNVYLQLLRLLNLSTGLPLWAARLTARLQCLAVTRHCRNISS
jgi:hypothetical protein